MAIKMGMVPKRSDKIPANKIGKSDSPETIASNTPKTLPRSCSGVFSCNTVWEGIITETTEIPKSSEPKVIMVASDG